MLRDSKTQIRIPDNIVPPLQVWPWTKEEDDILLEHVRVHGTRKWKELVESGKLPKRNTKACCNRFRRLRIGQGSVDSDALSLPTAPPFPGTLQHPTSGTPLSSLDARSISALILHNMEGRSEARRAHQETPPRHRAHELEASAMLPEEALCDDLANLAPEEGYSHVYRNVESGVLPAHAGPSGELTGSYAPSRNLPIASDIAARILLSRSSRSSPRVTSMVPAGAPTRLQGPSWNLPEAGSLEALVSIHGESTFVDERGLRGNALNVEAEHDWMQSVQELIKSASLADQGEVLSGGGSGGGAILGRQDLDLEEWLMMETGMAGPREAASVQEPATWHEQVQADEDDSFEQMRLELLHKMTTVSEEKIPTAKQACQLESPSSFPCIASLLASQDNCYASSPTATSGHLPAELPPESAMKRGRTVGSSASVHSGFQNYEAQNVGAQNMSQMGGLALPPMFLPTQKTLPSRLGVARPLLHPHAATLAPETTPSWQNRLPQNKSLYDTWQMDEFPSDSEIGTEREGGEEGEEKEGWEVGSRAVRSPLGYSVQCNGAPNPSRQPGVSTLASSLSGQVSVLSETLCRQRLQGGTIPGTTRNSSLQAGLTVGALNRQQYFGGPVRSSSEPRAAMSWLPSVAVAPAASVFAPQQPAATTGGTRSRLSSLGRKGAEGEWGTLSGVFPPSRSYPSSDTLKVEESMTGEMTGVPGDNEGDVDYPDPDLAVLRALASAQGQGQRQRIESKEWKIGKGEGSPEKHGRKRKSSFESPSL